MSSDLTRECPGLPAEWINGWLAAVGITVLDPEIRLSWTSGPSPMAVLHHPSKDPVAAVCEAWPDRQRLEDMPLARGHENCSPDCDGAKQSCKERRPESVESFRQLTERSRGHADAWTITSTLTDLAEVRGKSGQTAHGQFDAGGPGTIKWLHYRLLKVHQHIPGDSASISVAILSALDGISVPVDDNGLGFDLFRLPDRAREGGSPKVEPVVEVLAFFGLALLPVRGDGILRSTRARQRGHGIGGRWDSAYLWPAWEQLLDRWGIDALLDAWHRTWHFCGNETEAKEWRTSKADWDLLGVTAGWETQNYKPTKDSNEGFGSQSVSPDRGRVDR